MNVRKKTYQKAGIAVTCLILFCGTLFLAGERDAESTRASASDIVVDIASIVDSEQMIAVHYPVTNRAGINMEALQYIQDEIRAFERGENEQAQELNITFDVKEDEEGLFVVVYEKCVRTDGQTELVRAHDVFVYDAQTGNRRSDLGRYSPQVTALMEETAAVNALPALDDDFAITYEGYEDEDYSNRKLIALTFDDGPHKDNTTELLRILEEHEVKATFYVLGNRAQYNPGIIREMVQSGHQVGSHTYSHKELSKLSQKERMQEIQKTNDIIERIIGIQPSSMRPPYGAYDEAVTADAGMPVVLWSLDSEDWKLKDSEKIFRKVTAEAKDGDIILLHDIHSYTVGSIKQIIVKLLEEGYTFVTVDELIRTRGTLGDSVVYTQLI